MPRIPPKKAADRVAKLTNRATGEASARATDRLIRGVKTVKPRAKRLKRGG